MQELLFNTYLVIWRTCAQCDNQDRWALQVYVEAKKQQQCVLHGTAVNYKNAYVEEIFILSKFAEIIIVSRESRPAASSLIV